MSSKKDADELYFSGFHVYPTKIYIYNKQEIKKMKRRKEFEKEKG